MLLILKNGMFIGSLDFTNCDFDLLTRIKFIVYQIYDYSFKEVLGGVLYYVNLKQSNKFFF